MSYGTENAFATISGMMQGIREEWSGDVRRNRTRLASLLQDALTGASDLADAVFRISEVDGPEPDWPHRLSPFETGRSIVHLRYDRTCLVLRGMIEAAGRPMSVYRPVLRHLLAFLAVFERIHGLCEPFIRKEKG